MGMAYINSRCKEILKLLLAAEDYVPVQRIAVETKVSRRSIYYDLCKLNDWLSVYNIPELEVERRKGILIPQEIKKKIESIIEDESREDSYVFSPTERVKIIICYIIHMGKPVYIEQLSEYCQVSRNTIFNDLRIVVNQLQEYNLSLAYESKKGYRIEGDIIRIRALFFLYFNTLMPLLDSGVMSFINHLEVNPYYEKLKKIESELNTEYVDGILISLAALLPLMYKSLEKPYFPNLRVNEIKRTQEFQLVKAYFSDLDAQEQIYLCLHLLGSRVAVKGNEMFDNSANQSVYEITKALVAEFEKKACVFFNDKDELERELFMHINTSLYRYQYGIQIGNPLCNDVIREYPNLFDITKYVCKYLAQLVGLPISDSEVAYLALHFGAHLKASKPLNERIRILIVCVNGVSTSNMLKKELQKLLPQAQIVDVVAAVDVIQVQNICDLVISTVKIKSLVPVIVVHPILTDYDRKAILSHKLIAKKRKLSDSDELFDVIKKYVKEEDYEKLKLDLVKYLYVEKDNIHVEKEYTRKGLLSFLSRNRIDITKEEFTWQEAIHFAGERLIQYGSIEKKYLGRIVSQIQYYGPYMFIAKGLVLAHAKPEDGVNHLDVSMTIFKKAVRFSEYNEANVIITLAAEDQEKHLKILKDIMSIFAEEQMEHMNKIVKLDSEEEILHFIQQCIHEEADEEEII
ncbi:MAG: transcription antiterminator [Lachnospiraceae bacterium]|nr:transcription antiterminator [Lachnospiraceae bacterium]